MRPLWWKRHGVTQREEAESRAAVVEARAQEVTVDVAVQHRRETKNRNGFGPLIEEGMSGGRTR